MTYRPLLGADALHGALELRHEGKLNQAELLLLCATPTPAVADELRKVYQSKATRDAARGDWLAVIGHLADYASYVRDAEADAIRACNQSMPRHNARAYALYRRAYAEAVAAGLPTLAGPDLTEVPIPGPAEIARIYAKRGPSPPDPLFVSLRE